MSNKEEEFDRRLEEMSLRHFPPQIVEPWQKWAGEEVPDWQASIFPQVPEARGRVRYMLNGSYLLGGVEWQVTLGGDSQEELIAQAKTVSYFWEHVEVEDE